VRGGVGKPNSNTNLWKANQAQARIHNRLESKRIESPQKQKKTKQVKRGGKKESHWPRIGQKKGGPQAQAQD